MSADPVALPLAAPDFTDLFAKIKASFRYDDSSRWFDPDRLRYIEAIDRGSKPPVFAFVYEPTGRHLFLDDRGRTYRFTRASDPTKAIGTFTLHYGRSSGFDELRPAPLTDEPGAAFWNDDLFASIDDLPCSTGCYGDGMRREITQRELRNQSGEIMRALEQGDEFLVTRNGVPVGELLPIRRGNFVRSEVLHEAMRGAPHVDFRELRADLEAVASYDPTPRV